jgi:pentachlorophenol monooxygenase/3-(3-hydroxy-phenyl)propionate hydroxylase
MTAGLSPIVIVGNGPVGQTAALLLARWNLPVVLLDERPRRDAIGSRALCQQRDVLDIWDSVGAGAQIAAEGLTWRTVRTFYKEHELFAYDLQDHGHSILPPFVNISQCRTEEILDERIARQPLIDVRWGHRARHVRQSSKAIAIDCDVDGRPMTIAGSFGLLCAGARSEELRRDLGVSFEGVSFDDRFLICDIQADLPDWSRERRFYFDPAWNPGRQVLIHPCPEQTFRIDWQVPGDYDLDEEHASGALDRRIRAIIGDRSYRVVWKSVYRFHSRVVNRMQVGRILLAGDCAHLFSPFGARGLNSGVADVENAAWKLAYVLRGWAHESLLESFHDERHAAALENLDVTTRTMNFLVPHTDAERHHRIGLLTRALSDRSAWSEIDSGRLAEPFWYVQSPLTTPDASRPFGGRPPRGNVPTPGPGVLVPDVPVTVPETDRLRRLCRTGILVLTAAGVEPEAVAQAVESIPAPVRVIPLGQASRDDRLTQALDARAHEAWVVRPDAHVAAVVDGRDVSAVATAVARVLARDSNPARES